MGTIPAALLVQIWLSIWWAFSSRMPRSGLVLRSLPGTHQIAQRLVLLVEDPHRREVACP